MNAKFTGPFFIMVNDTHKVSIAAVGNLMLASAGNVLDKTASFLHILLTIGQVGVATITIIYIWKKIKALKKTK